jgi:hypothetical protein
MEIAALTASGPHKCLWIATALAALASPAIAQEVQNPAARRTDADSRNLLEGSWNGANLERRSACSNAQNNGDRGTYAEYNVSFDRAANLMGIDETTVSGLRCTYLGTYVDDRFHPQWNGSYTCSDGKAGTFTLQNFLASANAMSIRLSIKLTGTETCSIDAILGGSRF